MGGAASIPLKLKQSPEMNGLIDDPNRQYVGNILNIAGGTITESLVGNETQLKGISTGTEYTYFPDVLSSRLIDAGDSTETGAYCSFVQPAIENTTRGNFVYYVSKIDN